MHVALNGMLLGPQAGGVEYSILHLARALAEHGSAQYTLYVPAGSLPDLPQSDRMRVHRVPRRMPGRFARIVWEQAFLPRLIDKHNADLLHAPGYIAPLRARKPVVLTVYDTIALQFPQWSKRANTLHYRLLLPASVRKASVVLAPSEATRRDLCRICPGSTSKIRVVPLGIATQFFATPDHNQLEELRRRLTLPSRFILFVGRHEPKKNLPELLESFAMLKKQDRIPHQLVIAGRHGWRTDPLHHHIRRLGLEDETVLTGFLPDKDMPLLYAAAELFVFPSLYEGFGLPPLEAMACGIPVVASDRGALAENLSDAALLVAPGDPAALAAAVRSALSDKDLHANLAASGRRRAARFSWEQTARETDRAHRDALGDTP